MRCGHVVVVVREVGIATLENCATSQELLDFRLLYQQLGSTSFSSCLVDWTDSSSDRTATTQQMRERARERRRHIQVESSRKSGRRRVKSGDSERRINNGRRRPLQLIAAQTRATDRVAGVANKAGGPRARKSTRLSTGPRGSLLRGDFCDLMVRSRGGSAGNNLDRWSDRCSATAVR